MQISTKIRKADSLTHMKKQLISAAELLLTAIIWGVAFVAQSVSMDYIEPYTFTCNRSLLGGAVLIPVIFLLKKIAPTTHTDETDKKSVRIHTIVGGICCGCCLCAASCFQQFGIMDTTVGKAGFITALYIVIVPLFGIFLKKRIPIVVWLSCIVAIIGFYLLSMSGEVSLSRGDFLVLICAFLFSIHILCIDYFSPRGNSVIIACIQFFTCGIISGVLMLLFETPRMENILAAAIPILYAGIMSSGVAYTLQVVAQKNISPTIATLIMSLESVFSALAGWLILGQALSGRELFGCVLVFIAVIMAQLPWRA